MIIKPSRRQILIAAWYLCLSFTLTYSLHYLQYHRGPGDYTYDLHVETHHRAAVELSDTAPLQYRILSYYLPELIRRFLKVSIPEAYSLFRWFWLWLGAVFLHWYLETWYEWRIAFLGNVLVMLSVPYMFLSDDLLPSDAPAYAFFVLSLVLLRKDRTDWLLLTIPLATAFRETSILILVAWALVIPALKKPKIEVIRLLAGGVLAAGVYVAIRVIIGPRYNPWAAINPSFIENALLRSSYFHMFFSAGLLWPLALWNVRKSPPFCRNLFLLIPLVVVTGWWYGVGWNGRYYWPLLPVLLPPALLVFNGKFTRALSGNSAAGPLSASHAVENQ